MAKKQKKRDDIEETTAYRVAYAIGTAIRFFLWLAILPFHALAWLIALPIRALAIVAVAGALLAGFALSVAASAAVDSTRG